MAYQNKRQCGKSIWEKSIGFITSPHTYIYMYAFLTVKPILPFCFLTVNLSVFISFLEAVINRSLLLLGFSCRTKFYNYRLTISIRPLIWLWLITQRHVTFCRIIIWNLPQHSSPISNCSMFPAVIVIWDAWFGHSCFVLLLGVLAYYGCFYFGITPEPPMTAGWVGGVTEWR